jgi:hypothetical protein
MANAFVQTGPDGPGKKVDNDRLTVAGTTVYRQRVNPVSPSNPAGLAEVVNAAPTTQYGLVTWGHRRLVKPTTSELSEAIINANGPADTTLIAAQPGQTIRLFRLLLVANGSLSITFKDGGTPLTPSFTLSTSQTFNLHLVGEPWLITSAGNALVLNVSNSTFVCGRAYYTQS